MDSIRRWYIRARVIMRRISVFFSLRDCAASGVKIDIQLYDKFERVGSLETQASRNVIPQQLPRAEISDHASRSAGITMQFSNSEIVPFTNRKKKFFGSSSCLHGGS